MGRVDATSLAYERNVLATNPTVTCEHSDRCDSSANWCLIGMRRRSDKATARIRGIGRRWRTWLVFQRVCEQLTLNQ